MKRSLMLIILAGLIAGFTIEHIVYLQHKPEYRMNDNLGLLNNLGAAEDVKITIVYDNNAYDQRLETAWGFACYVETAEEKILFDTGGDPEILFDNMRVLGISVEEIEIIILSHIHGDHVGSLSAILEENSEVTVYAPASFPSYFKNKVRDFGCSLVEVGKAQKICNGVITTGELGSEIKEQSLVVRSSRGLVVITGCAHPGVANIVEEVIELTNMNIYLVIGGFHLSGSSEQEIKSVMERFRSLNVTSVAPCHCSGEGAKQVFKNAFGSEYIDTGVGRVIEIKSRSVDC